MMNQKQKPFIKLVLRALAAILLCTPFISVLANDDNVNKFLIGVSAPSKVFGPESYIPDLPVTFFSIGGGVRGYVANANTYILEGPQVDNVSFREENGARVIAIGPGALGSFDSGGAWLSSVEWTEPDTLLGWYHAEKGPEPNEKSIAMAISYDNGLSFNKDVYAVRDENDEVIWPYNQVITPNFQPNPPSNPGHGDPTIITHGGYRYMYFLNTDPAGGPQYNPGAWHTSVARSGTWTRGVPMEWNKFYNGSWNQDGIGGEATKLGYFGVSASKYVNGTDQRVALLNPNIYSGGLMLTFGDIANPDAGSFQTVKDPLIPFDDSKPSGELINYPSAVHLHGGHEWSDHFVLFYLYVEPGADHDHDRYLIRRHVWVYKSSTEIVGPQVRLSLCQYYNSSKNDHWATTAYPPNYGYCVDDLGWIITSSDYDGTHAIYDLYDPVNDNHFVGFESEIHSGIINLRRLARLSLFALILADFCRFYGPESEKVGTTGQFETAMIWGRFLV